MPTQDARHISISIERSPEDVYRFVSHVPNLPRWAHGLGSEVRELNGEWIAKGALGVVKLRFVRANELGVLDHEVVLPSGDRVHNPLRVLPNGSGSEIVFSLFRQPGVSEQDFAHDQQAVARDLATLKQILESSSHTTQRTGEP